MKNVCLAKCLNIYQSEATNRNLIFNNQECVNDADIYEHNRILPRWCLAKFLKEAACYRWQESS